MRDRWEANEGSRQWSATRTGSDTALENGAPRPSEESCPFSVKRHMDAGMSCCSMGRCGGGVVRGEAS
eukprot:3936449-Rhodomonas_salina.4